MRSTKPDIYKANDRSHSPPYMEFVTIPKWGEKLRRGDSMNRFDMLNLSVEENRRAFRMAIETSNSDAIGYVAALATRLEIHRAYNAMSPGLFVQRNDANDEPGTIVGICGGRRFLISDSDVAWTVWQWRRLEHSDFVASAKSRRALALLVIADDAYAAHDADTIALQNDSSIGGLAIATRTILRCMELRDERAGMQSALDSCYKTIHAARKELGLSLRESSHIPSAIRAFKRKDA